MQEAKTARRGRPMIPVIRITNPFNPREHVREEIIWARKKTLAAYFPLVESTPVVVSVNGKIIPNEKFGVTYLSKTDNLVVCPVPTGGGSGKSILGTIAMIAVAVMAPYAAAALNAGLGLGLAAGSIGMGALTAGVVMAGSLLVSSIFAPAQKTSTGTNSSSYGIDGAKNTSTENVPVPVSYGQFRLGGNIVGLYTDNTSDDSQILYMLITAGEGPIASISDIVINNNPLADYTAATTTYADGPGVPTVEVQTRLGTPNQAVIPWFSNVMSPYNRSTRLTTDWTYHTTATPVDQIRLDFAAPSGLFSVDSKSGATNSRTVDLEVQIAPSGSGNWSAFGSGGIGISAAKRAAVRRSFNSGTLTNGKYDVRVRRTSAESTSDTVMDQMYLSDVNEIVQQQMTYPNTALLALKIALGTQISGIPTVTFMHGGQLIQAYGAQTAGATPGWYTAASKNPAWVVWDILTNKRYGGAMPAARLDFPAFQEWAAYCDQQGYEWNGPIDTEMNVWDACQLVLRVGHSQLVNIGTRYTIVTEKPNTPVMMFSVANMIEGSYKETWLGTQDRANEIDITYFDKTDSYKQRTLKVYDPAAFLAGAKQNTSAITLYGVTDYATAYKEGQFQLNLNRYILRTVQFSAPLEAVACSVGDLIYVQHDMTEWAQAGRFENGSTASVIQLDRPVTLSPGSQYKLMAMFDAVQRASGSVLSVVGTSVFLSGFDGSMPVKRIQINGRDLQVAGTFDQGGGHGVILEDATGVAPGQAYTLWDTDVIEEANVLNAPGQTTVLTLQSPLTSAPAQYANWLFGEVDKVKQPFRIKSVSGSGEYKRDITAIEYRPEVYDFSRYGTTPAPMPTVEGAIGPVTGLSLYEETYVSGSSIVTNIVASWAPPSAGNYAGADVFVQKNDGPLVKLIDAKNVTSAVISAAKGDKLTVQVQAYDIWGKRSQFELAPSAHYTVIGEVANIDVGGVTGAGFTWSGRDCKINWRYNSTTHSYEFGSEPTGGDAGALDPHFKDYEIRVYNSDGVTLRRTEYTADNSFVYIYDKNFADGLARHLVFEIRMRDIFNNLGQPAVLDAYNAPPQVGQITVATTFESATISYLRSDDPDFAGAQVYVSAYASDLADLTTPKAQTCLVYEGPDSSIVVPSLMFNQTYYYRVVPFDAFGKTELLPSAVLSFATSYFNVDTIKDEMIDVAKFAKTIDPVGIVDTLPDPATWDRPVVVFLTSDSKMYRLANGKWTSAVPAADVTGQMVSQQIADAAINTAKFAQGISPVGVVNSLPAVSGYTGPTVVLLSTDGKMYRLVNGAWTSAVPATDVTGQLTNAQLADINATKIAGQLTDAQLAAISAAKITGQLTDAQLSQISAAKVAGQLTDAQLSQISAAKVAGQMTDAQISAISAAKLTGTVTAAQIADAAISTAKFAAGIQPISVVSALPAVSGYTGPSVVFLTTTGKIYRLTSGAWTSAVPSTDMTGQITTTQIADNAITTAKITAGSITTGTIAAGAVTAGQIAADTITAGNIAAGAITASELAAGAVTASALSAGSVTTNALAAGSVTTANLTAGVITANELAANAVTTAKINAGAITTAQLSAGAVTANELAANAVTTAKLSAGAVTTATLAAGAVTADTIASGAITSAKISAGAVTTATLASGAVTSDTLAANAVTAGKISAGAVTAGTLAAGVVTANELAASSVTSAKVAAGAITAGTIAANAVTAGTIAANAVTSGTIAAGAITATQLAAGAVSAGSIAAGAITSDKIAANAITAGAITSGAITSDKIAANAVTAGAIAAGAVSASQIAAGAISADKLAAGQIITTSAQIGDGLIVSAKIGNAQVNTLQIGSQAVTIPVSAYTGYGQGISYGSNTVQSVGISSSGAPITVSFAAAVTPASYGLVNNEGTVDNHQAQWSIQLLRDGAQLFSAAGPTWGTSTDGTGGIVSFVIGDTPGAGYHTYQMVITVGSNSTASGGTASNCIINLLETKR